MDIVDAQVHMGPGGIEQMLAAMDALGIRSVLIDEYWTGERAGDPGYPVANDAFRPYQPTAELGAALHPERFSYLVRLDRRDTELPAIVRMARDAPSARALRITPGMWRSEAKAFHEGEYDHVCALASDHGLPLFVFAPTQAEVLRRIARKFPEMRLVFDHCGLMSNSMREVLGHDPTPHTLEEQLVRYDEVLGLADFPNIGLKWAHAPGMFESKGFPGDALWPMLEKALNVFGAERVMWASDATMQQSGESWAELLFGLRCLREMRDDDRDALLGGTARRWLKWPA